ncbi:RDD family protein [Arthrobacter sp. A2-55]|uniref:RDD family protein n=1 Tax=Arthrobacter sp. A2-55 TaxID=2897337 RepID=UPI0021CDA87C|nr:RDD family protein [Arthrobacter sp. A2-55]MCU6481517.1 RDD family protein [Arthrobacter sp. A2-55]
MSAIITGEAVVLELRPASFAARSLGAAIDVLVTIVLVIGAVWAFATIPFMIDAAAAKAIFLVLLVGILVGVPVAVETMTRGRSLGKLALGLRIVRDDGGSIRFRHALIRGLLGVFEIYMTLGSVAFLVSLFNEKSKRLGDMVAGTYAIRDRAPQPKPLQVFVVPALQPWAKLADIGRLPDSLARRISIFLRQGTQMSPESRFAMAASLAEEASPHVAPLPPAGTPPEVFLSALISERRDREFARLSAAAVQADKVRLRLAAHGVGGHSGAFSADPSSTPGNTRLGG